MIKQMYLMPTIAGLFSQARPTTYIHKSVKGSFDAQFRKILHRVCPRMTKASCQMILFYRLPFRHSAFIDAHKRVLTLRKTTIKITIKITMAISIRIDER